MFLNALRHQAKRPGLEVEGTRFINGVLATPAQIANYSACVLKVNPCIVLDGVDKKGLLRQEAL